MSVQTSVNSSWLNPVRHPEDVGVGILRRRFLFSEFDGAPSRRIPMGALEKGSIPLGGNISARVAVAGGTPKVDVGTIGNAVGYGTGAGGTTPTALAGALLGSPVTADTIVYVVLNASASAGDFECTLQFSVDRNSPQRFPYPPT